MTGISEGTYRIALEVAWIYIIVSNSVVTMEKIAYMWYNNTYNLSKRGCQQTYDLLMYGEHQTYLCTIRYISNNTSNTFTRGPVLWISQKNNKCFCRRTDGDGKEEQKTYTAPRPRSDVHMQEEIRIQPNLLGVCQHFHTHVYILGLFSLAKKILSHHACCTFALMCA